MTRQLDNPTEVAPRVAPSATAPDGEPGGPRRRARRVPPPQRPDGPARRQQQAHQRSPLRLAAHRVNAFFYSKQTGLLLILAMAFFTLMGTLLQQSPDGVRGDEQAYAQWLDSVRPRYGGWTSVLAAVGFFEVFSSWFFTLTSVLLAISIVRAPCTAPRSCGSARCARTCTPETASSPTPGCAPS